MEKFPRQASIYWFDPAPVTGAEMRKIRPCIVISPDEMNAHLKTVIIAPLTTAIRAWPFRPTVRIMAHKSSVACDQLRAIDKSRLKDNIGSLQPADAAKVFEVLQAMFSE